MGQLKDTRLNWLLLETTNRLALVVIDFHETMYPIAKPLTIHMCYPLLLLWLDLFDNLDVKNAFLYGDLSKEVYMKQPPRFVHHDHPSHVNKLKKSIYGPKQAPRAWFHKFSCVPQSHCFVCSVADTSICNAPKWCYNVHKHCSYNDDHCPNITDKPNGWGITAFSKDKAPSTNVG